MEYKKNTFDVQDGVGIISMNYPKNLNALDVEMTDELLSLLDRCENDPEIKIVMIRSSGKAFSAGGDVGYFYENIKAGGELKLDGLFAKVGQLSLKIKKMSKLVITAVSGAAAGAGANLALSGDFVIAADNAKFIQAFINLGLVPDTGGSFLLSKTVGPARAMELCATGRPLTAAEAKDWGLVYQVCASAELDGTAMELAKKLTAGPLKAYANLKKQFFNINYSGYEEYLRECELPAQVECSGTDDFKEGVCAFMEKRKANFAGK